MLKPNQYEQLNKTILVLGADILKKIKRKEYMLEDLFKEIKKKKDISVNQFMNAVTFLWIVDAIEYSEFTLSIKKQ